ncbi:MAG: hypothetical protein AB1696_27065 [Planctomycetota bacterium]
MQTINRSVLVVKAREPFLKWLLHSFPDLSYLTLEEANDDNTVYLIPECDDDSEVEKFLEGNYAAIFEEQVSTWSQDVDEWPDVNDLQTFREWFDVKFHSLVVDLGDGPVETDEME